MKLLIVEDDNAAIKLYKSSIDIFNLTNGADIQPTINKTFEEAQKSLNNPEFDAAIIDLRLSAGEELQGQEIIKEINNKLRFPIFIVSGSIAQVELEETALLKKRPRDCDHQEMFKEMHDLYNTGITQILGKKGTIDKYLNKIFWEHLADSVDLWTKDNSRTPQQKEQSLLRYILLHIQEYLELTEESDFEHYHPAEIYITPPIKPRVFTGDIVKDKQTDNTYIVLTPSCDLAQTKAKEILLAEIEPMNNCMINDQVRCVKGKATQEKKDQAEEAIKKLIGNSYSNKYHFLPAYSNITGGLINFQKLSTAKARDFDAGFERLASLNTHFVKDIIARFSYYYSRQGSPDFITDEIYKTLLN